LNKNRQSNTSKCKDKQRLKDLLVAMKIEKKDNIQLGQVEETIFILL